MDADMNDESTANMGLKWMPCRYCKRPMLVGSRTKRAPSHVECGTQVAMENARQIALKEGPYYERWRAGMRNWAENAGGGAPPRDTGTH